VAWHRAMYGGLADWIRSCIELIRSRIVLSMSRPRVRPPREETRKRLFEAAAEVFAEHGIAGASVEAITTAAGFTRGAFYSNFADKDELVTAMLADHVEQTVRRHVELLARHRNPDDFMTALRAVDRRTQDPLGRSPLLHLELLLYAARAVERRHDLAEFLEARRQIIVDIVEGTGLSAADNGLLDSGQLAAMLLAMEDGFRLHQLIDPKRTPSDSFLRSISALQRALRPAKP
jgi:AcrR family transcriptional regulator